MFNEDHRELLEKIGVLMNKGTEFVNMMNLVETNIGGNDVIVAVGQSATTSDGKTIAYPTLLIINKESFKPVLFKRCGIGDGDGCFYDVIVTLYEQIICFDKSCKYIVRWDGRNNRFVHLTDRHPAEEGISTEISHDDFFRAAKDLHDLDLKPKR